MDAPLNKLQIVPNREAQMEALSELREELKSLMRQSSKEVDLTILSNLQAQIASLNRKIAKLTQDLGLSGLMTVKDAKASARRRFLPTQELTVEQLLTLAAAGKQTPEGAAALAEMKALPGVVSLIMPWVPPPFPKSPDANSVAAFMAGARTYRPVAPVLRCPKDPHFKKEGGLKNLATVTQPPQYVGQDGEWIALLQQLPEHLKKYSGQVKEALERAVTGYYVASGPFEGWLARILKGDARPHPNFVLTEAEFRVVCEALPWNASLAPDFSKVTLMDLLKSVRVNGAAGSGMPRHYKKAVVMKEMLGDAAQYFELLGEKKLNAYMQQYPGEFLTIAKMKLDRYEAEDWGKKVRPYYNLNGGLALIYSCVTQAYSGCLTGFWMDPKSCNAHGFAWNSGGGDRLYAWVLWASKQPPGLYAIGYSDDGLWVIKTHKGVTIVSDRDIEQEDASCGNSFLGPYRGHVLAVLEPKLTPGWRNVTHAAVAAVFRQLIILYKSLVYASENKIHSGMPGTAEADQVAFAVLYTLVRKVFNELYTVDRDGEEISVFDEAVAKVTTRIGLRFKEARWHPFKADEDSYPWEFLGKRLHRFRGHYIPVVTLQKAVVQLVTPKRSAGGLEGQRAWVERARGLAVTSLFWHEPLYELAKAAYARKLKLGVKPAATMDGEETGENDLDQILGQGVNLSFKDDNFPSRGWIYNFYLGLPIEEAEAHRTPVLSPVQSAASVFMELYPEPAEHVPGGAWADAEPEAPEMLAAKRPLEEGQRIVPLSGLPVTEGSKPFQLAPLPEEVKRAYHDARRAAFRVFAGDKPERRGRYLKGGMMERMIFRPEDTQIVFTKNGIETRWQTAAMVDEGMSGWATEDELAMYYPEDLEDDDEIDRRLERAEDERLEIAWNKSHYKSSAEYMAHKAGKP